MNSKSTTLSPTVQPLCAGLEKFNSNIEFFGIEKTRTTKFLMGGKVYTWEELPLRHYLTLLNAYNKNVNAREKLTFQQDEDGSFVKVPVTRRVELFTYYCYGSLDHKPDIIEGVLQEPENFRHSLDCISLNFKDIRINGEVLKPREIKMLDLFGQDHKDEVVAIELGIKRATLNSHKSQLFSKAGVFSKPALMVRAMFDQVIKVTAV